MVNQWNNTHYQFEELVSGEGLRQDGRRVQDLRHIKIALNVQKKFNGSAIYEIGNTKILAYILGPKEVDIKYRKRAYGKQGILNVNFFITNFSTLQHKENPKRELKMRDFAKVMKDCLEGIILLENYQKSQIDLNICVLQNDGGYKAAAFTAASLALIDAGIEMKDILIGLTAGYINSEVALDLLQSEQKLQSCVFLTGYLPQKRAFAYLDLESPKVEAGELMKILKTAEEGSYQLYELLVTEIKRAASFAIMPIL